MRTNGHQHDDHIDAGAGYEKRDIALDAVVKWVVGLFAFVLFTIALTIPFYMLIVPKDDRTGQNELRPTMTQKPPEPMLHDHPIRDMGQFERLQQEELTSYGRIKDQPGKVHIPIEKAIDQVLAQGLSAQGAAQAPPPPNGIYTAGDTTAPWPASPRQARVTLPGSAPPGPAGSILTSPSGNSPAAGQPVTGEPTSPGPAAPPGPPTLSSPRTTPGGVTEEQMRGAQDENTPAPRRDEPR